MSAPGYTIADTAITVGSTSNWSTDTGVVFAIDEAQVVDGQEVQVAGTYNEYIGVVASGTSVTSVAWQTGVGDRNYASGALTRVYIPVSAERENRIVTWGTTQHNQDGTHAAVTATTVTTSTSIITDTVAERTAANGVSVDGLNIKDGKLNTDASVIPNNLVASSGTSWAWQSWTPTWTNFTVGNGTVTAKYNQVGKTVRFRVYVTLGTTSSVTGAISLSLPVTISASYVAQSCIGVGLSGLSTGSGYNQMIITWLTSTTASAGPTTAGGAYTGLASTSSTVPFTWTNNSFLTLDGAYEAA